MHPASGDWRDLGTQDFAHLDPERCVAVLPVAAIEQHGPHLPLATDARINEGLVASLVALRPTDVLILPPMQVGHSLEHADYPGTLGVPAEALLATWVEIGRSVARAGVRKLVILNTHGGNIPLVQLAALRLRASERMLVVRANYFSFGAPPGLFAADELRHGIHGGEMETSLMLHLAPHLVRMQAAASFGGLSFRMGEANRWLGVERPAGIGWLAQDLNESGVCGNAAAADAARGARLLAHLAEASAQLIDELVATPLDVLRTPGAPPR